MLFTTRSIFDNYNSTEVTEIADKKALLSLAGCFFSDVEKHMSVLEQIIDTVHSQTLTVEISAKLLKTGILEPQDLLEKLKEEKGFIQTKSCHAITLHPMIQEVAITETRPSVQNCRILLNSLQEIYLRHGEEVSYYRQLFQTH